MGTVIFNLSVWQVHYCFCLCLSSHWCLVLPHLLRRPNMDRAAGPCTRNSAAPAMSRSVRQSTRTCASLSMSSSAGQAASSSVWTLSRLSAETPLTQSALRQSLWSVVLSQYRWREWSAAVAAKEFAAQSSRHNALLSLRSSVSPLLISSAPRLQTKYAPQGLMYLTSLNVSQ